MPDQDDENPTGGYWPSVTDLFITLFIISIVLLGAVFYILLPKNNIAASRAVQVAVGEDFVKVLEPVNRLREEVGLEPVRYRSASQTIKDLGETCDVAIGFLKELKKNDPEGMTKRIRDLETKLRDLESLIEKLREQIKKVPGSEVEELRRRIEELEQENQELKRDSPSVVIGEKRQDFRFDSGSPVIKQEFSKALRNRIPDGKGGFYEPPFPQIADEIIKRQERINTLEIIGHTDGVPLSTSGNLDKRLPELLAGELGGSKTLSAGSNNDLGLLRALALKQEWLDYVESYVPIENREVLRRIHIRSYSAGQTILPVRIDSPKPADFRKNDPRARRIEMRLTRLAKVTGDE